MKKVIRLTESDIRMIVKRIIKESNHEDRDYDYIYQELGNHGLHPNYMYFDEFEQSNFYDPRMTDDEYVASMYDFITQENYNDEYRKALKDINVLIPLISHDIIHKNGIEHTEENMVKLNSEIKQKVEQGDDDILDKMWDLAGSTILKHAINVITHYHKNN